MLSLQEHRDLQIFEEMKYLEEKLILMNNGKKFGQIVFMAGGAGSGKGFAISNFIEGEKFKIRGVDEWKKTLMKIADLKNKHKEIQGLNLRKGSDVFKLHMFVKKLGVNDKTMNNLLLDLRQDRLPNILFDITAKSPKDIANKIPALLNAGYEPRNIHLVWVLTNYSVAVKNNADRARVVPDDILLQTHEGAAKTMWTIIDGGKMPLGVDGRFDVILNNRENTVFFTGDVEVKGKKKVLGGTTDFGKARKDAQGRVVVKSFLSLNIKKEGQKMKSKDSLRKELHSWVATNVPKTAFTSREMDI